MPYHRVVQDIVPASGTEDISSLIGDCDIPQLLGFQYWVSNVGIGVVGTFAMSISWVDIDGTTRSIPGNALSLLGLSNIFSSPVNVIKRRSTSDPVNLTSTLVGLPLGGRVSYVLCLTNGFSEGSTPF